MIEETGEHIIAGAGELHLEICLKDLQDDFMGGAEIKVSWGAVWLAWDSACFVSLVYSSNNRSEGERP